MALTHKQALFAQEYLIDGNATAAAIRAGYSVNTARSTGAENLTKPDIAAAIDAAMLVRAERTAIDQDYVVRNLAEIVSRCMQRAPVTNAVGVQEVDADGAGVWTFNATSAIRALELLGKNIGMFKEIKEHTGKNGKPMEFVMTVSPAIQAIIDDIAPGEGQG